jgi:Cysteine-rich secretory protein family/S-layer homology domain
VQHSALGRGFVGRGAKATLGAATIFLVMCVFLLLPPAAWAKDYDTAELRVLELINGYRAQNGLVPLLLSDALSTSADRHSHDMGRYAFFGHDTVRSDWFPAGASPWSRMAACGYGYDTTKGENIAAGYADAATVFAGWRASPGHNANILGRGFTVIGIGHEVVAGSPYNSYWTTDFGGLVDATAHRPSTGTPGPFPDVSTGDPYAVAITTLAARGVVTGYDDGYFRPEWPVSRQQFAKMVITAAGFAVSEADDSPFPDVALTGPGVLYPDHYVAVAARLGITQGTSRGLFEPTLDITRAQVISMVVRAADAARPGRLPALSPGFAGTWGDVPGPEHADAVRRAEAGGLLAGLPLDRLDAWGPMTRAECGQVLGNLATLLGH